MAHEQDATIAAQAEVARLTGELAEAKKWIWELEATSKILLSQQTEIGGQLASCREREGGLREAIRTYGLHALGCPAPAWHIGTGWVDGDEARCICWLARALAEKP